MKFEKNNDIRSVSERKSPVSFDDSREGLNFSNNAVKYFYSKFNIYNTLSVISTILSVIAISLVLNASKKQFKIQTQIENINKKINTNNILPLEGYKSNTEKGYQDLIHELKQDATIAKENEIKDKNLIQKNKDKRSPSVTSSVVKKEESKVRALSKASTSKANNLVKKNTKERYVKTEKQNSNEKASLQIGLFTYKGKALAYISKITKQQRVLLRYSTIIENQKNNNNETLYKVRVINIENKKEAEKLCAYLKENNINCFLD